MNESGYVYVAEQKDRPGYCKVGKTRNPDSREKNLSGSAMAQIDIVECVQVDDMDAVEKAFHAILPRTNRQGEWFNIETERVLPMLQCLKSKQQLEAPTQPSRPQKHSRSQAGSALPGKTPPIEDASGSKVAGRGGWHEDGWRMHCEGATQAEIAKKFGVTEGAVVAMKKKMRGAGRRSEEARRSAPRRDRVAGGRGDWHEVGWQMHCEGATQAEIAKRFGVTEGAVVAMKKKMRGAGRRSEEVRRSAPRRGRVAGGRGSWHEDGWRMYCEGATQAEIAKKFGVTEGAVYEMKKKMRKSGRGSEEARRPAPRRGRKVR